LFSILIALLTFEIVWASQASEFVIVSCADIIDVIRASVLRIEVDHTGRAIWVDARIKIAAVKRFGVAIRHLRTV
jgi:hypothetical protein